MQTKHKLIEKVFVLLCTYLPPGRLNAVIEANGVLTLGILSAGQEVLAARVVGFVVKPRTAPLSTLQELHRLRCEAISERSLVRSYERPWKFLSSKKTI
ncbi:hypothetical protein PAMA_014227 [Pampus argenteus]